MQAVLAFVLVNLMDRAIGVLRRRKAMRIAGADSAGETGAATARETGGV